MVKRLQGDKRTRCFYRIWRVCIERDGARRWDTAPLTVKYLHRGKRNDGR